MAISWIMERAVSCHTRHSWLDIGCNGYHHRHHRRSSVRVKLCRATGTCTSKLIKMNISRGGWLVGLLTVKFVTGNERAKLEPCQNANVFLSSRSKFIKTRFFFYTSELTSTCFTCFPFNLNKQKIYIFFILSC